MPARAYVTPSSYRPDAAEFTIATIDGDPYLQMGALDRDDAALFRSLLDGWAGFFTEEGQRVGVARIIARYDAEKGVALGNLPNLQISNEYHVRFSQARPGRDGKDGANRRTGGMQPISRNRMEGRRYGPMIPFNRYDKPRMCPYTGDGMTGKPSGDPMTGRLPKEREGAQDILRYLDGQPELVRDYMLDLVREAISENNFTDALLLKLNEIEDRATRDQSDVEILALLLGLNANQRDSLRNGINAQVAGSYAPGSTISATANNVLAALVAMSTSQENSARSAIGIGIESLERHDWDPNYLHTNLSIRVNLGFYYRIGRLVFCYLNFTRTDSSAIGSGSFGFDPPVTLVSFLALGGSNTVRYATPSRFIIEPVLKGHTATLSAIYGV